MADDLLPEIRTDVPGPRSRALAARQRAVECPEVTPADGSVIFWERGAGANVFDVDGNRYVDLLAGFGVVALGHAAAEPAAAAAAQVRELGHAMGDVYPARVKVELLERLAALLPGELGLPILSTSGSDAVESALKTAQCATGRAGVVAFEGAYHGLGLGALDATHRAHFRERFEAALPHRTVFVPYGDAAAAARAARESAAGAILFEPIQGRGGVRVAPVGFIEELRRVADAEGALLVADEVYTGLGRTGRWLACEHAGVLPDLVALGKALGGGYPLSACAGRPDVMRAWGESTGEAIHTATHLGNPVGCAMALATLRRLEDERLPQRAARLGAAVLERLRRDLSSCPHVRGVRGRGLMLGIELDAPARAERVVGDALRAGWILLGEGEDGRVLALTPPLTISEEVLDAALAAVVELVRR